MVMVWLPAELTVIVPDEMVMKPAPSEVVVKQQLQQLNTMGFGTPRANERALRAADGNLEVAVDILLTADYTMLTGEEESPPPYGQQM